MMKFNFLFSLVSTLCTLTAITMNSAFAGNTGKVIFSGSIVSSPCTISNDSDLRVQLNTASKQNTQTTPFNINFSNCDIGTDDFILIFHDVTNSSKNINLLDHQSKKIMTDGKKIFYPSDLKSDSSSINLKANYTPSANQDINELKILEIQYH